MRDDAALATRIDEATRDAVRSKTGGEFAFEIANTNRSIGARLSGEIARRYGDHGMDEAPSS